MSKNKDLTNTLQVDGTTYNINAVKADKVANKLIFNEVNADGEETPVVEFDGSARTSVTIVPADGGKFTGPIYVDTSNTPSDNEILNYGDIKKKVINSLQATSALATWTVTNGEGNLSYTNANNEFRGIVVVTGANEDLSSFAEKNANDKILPAYLYLCTDENNNGELYLGTSESSSPIRLSPKQLITAADKYHIPYLGGNTDAQNDSSFGINLQNSDIIGANGIWFRGPDLTNNLDIMDNKGEGICFPTGNEVLDEKGNRMYTYSRLFANASVLYFVPEESLNSSSEGDAKKVITEADLSNLNVGSATKLETARSIRVDLASSNVASFDGTDSIFPGVHGILPVARGGTGEANLADVKVGKATSATNDSTGRNISTGYYRTANNTTSTNKITIDSISPNEHDAGDGKGKHGNDGDIWIKYSTT